MIKQLFKPNIQTHYASVALLVLRLVAGIALILHGWGKIQMPMSWLPEGANINIAPFFQLLAAVSEFGGGIAWIIGVLTPLASFGIFITMMVAASVHIFIFKDPFVNLSGGLSYESALGYAAMALVLLLVGPGKLSLDKLIFGEK